MKRGLKVDGGRRGIDVTRPNIARTYDYWLGGKDNFPVDRELGERMLNPETGYPGLKQIVRENRQFVTAAVTWVVGAKDVTQIIDAGAGLPTRPAVHQTARAVNPKARVAYVDSDSMVVSHCRALLATQPGIVAAEADLRHPEEVYAAEEVQAVIDTGRPVCVLLAAVLHFLSPGESRDIVRRFMAPLPAGSCAVISACRYDDLELWERLRAMYTAGPWHNHDTAAIELFLAAGSLKVTRHGVGDVASWRLKPAGFVAGTREACVLGGIGFKG
jgi:hypothetical protein